MTSQHQRLDKNQLRREMLAARRAIAPADAQAAAQSVAMRILPLIPEAATMVAGYRAVQGELDPMLALSRVIWRGTPTCLPVTVSGDRPLVFKAWQPGDALVRGKFSVEEPLAHAPLAEPDVLLVPLVAFDRNGHRLGYGAGYYDRTIAALRKNGKPLKIIGIGYHMQCVEFIPVFPHDERLDAIVTDKESIIP